jgi:uncharacterized protein (TIGR03067 family)
MIAPTAVFLLATGLGDLLLTPGGWEQRQRLLGEWRSVHVELGDRRGTPTTWVFTPTRIVLTDALQAVHEYAYRIDPRETPKAIDLIWLGSSMRTGRMTFRGIYRLEGDLLTLIYTLADADTPEGKLRPRAFELAPRLRTALYVLRRSVPGDDTNTPPQPTATEAAEIALDRLPAVDPIRDWWFPVAVGVGVVTFWVAYRRLYRDRR